MKRFFIVLILLANTLAQAQTWQWGKRGGSDSTIIDAQQLERVYSIVTDSQKNSYMLANIGKTTPDIDGVPKVNYGDDITIVDVALVSFACDGSYRWSKMISSAGVDRVPSLQLDAQDNVYVSGKFGGCAENFYPLHIDEDVVVDAPTQFTQDCSIIFIAKFSSAGVLQWFKRPQSSTIGNPGRSQTDMRGHVTDAQGNSYWLVLLPPCTIANGAYTVAQAGFYLLHYDTLGTFVSATPIDIQNLTLGVKLTRNPYNGLLYLYGGKGNSGASNDYIGLGGQILTHAVFIACFNLQGQLLWVREDTATVAGRITLYNLAFDNANNIYVGGRLNGLNSTNFLGLQIPGLYARGFVMKVNPDGTSLQWSSYNGGGADYTGGGLDMRGNEVGFAGLCFGNSFVWGNQTLTNISNDNEGTRVLLARFNKDTGTCLGLSYIPGTVGYDDWAGALAIDSSGDYIIGGSFGYQLVLPTTTLQKVGGNTDFFIAKYSTSPCSPLATTQFETKETIHLAPNPAKAYTDVAYNETLTSLQVVDMLGRTIATLPVTQQEGVTRIETASWAAGQYVVLAKNGAQVVKTMKLLISN